jgi:hypothetical protein
VIAKKEQITALNQTIQDLQAQINQQTEEGEKRSMPVKGYDSVNVPSGLYEKIKALIKRRSDLGYRSVTEFVAEAVRTKLVEIGETAPPR